MKNWIYCCLFVTPFAIAQSERSELFLSELIQIESLSGCEIEAARKIESWALSNNLYVTNFENNEDSKNILVSLYPIDIGKPNIVFTSHLDVVPADNPRDWKFPPFSGTIANDTVWGRGALDCKGLAVMQLYALKRFKDSLGKNTFPYNVSFLGLVEEETQSVQGAALISEKFIDLIHPVVMFGEGGAGMQHVLTSRPQTPVFGISVADKSSLWLKLEAEGGGFGHGAVPSDLYANKRLIKALIRLLDEKKSIRFHPIVRHMFDRIGEMEGGMRGFVIKNISSPLFWPFVKEQFREGEPFHTLVDNTFSITHIESSATVSNQMAERASAVLDCRLMPGTDVDKFIKKMKRTVGNRVSIDIIYQSPTANASPTIGFFDKMAQAVKKVYPGSETMPILFPASTDNNFFRNKSIPVYGLIPSVLTTELMESIHNYDERISISSLHAGIDVYYQFLMLNR